MDDTQPKGMIVGGLGPFRPPLGPESGAGTGEEGSEPGEEMAGAEEGPEPEVEIDLHILATKLVTLLRQELTVERERSVRTRSW